jgi:hypothetical protein
MKTYANILAAALVFGLSLSGVKARADVEVSAAVQINATADFYEPLSAHGGWVEIGGYGRCWRPAGVSVEWRPYCDGHWVWTDCGWYWASDEPWGWACYHYGTWVDDPVNGWVWVPSLEWSPAWVEWRVGGGFIGWAPCGPRGYVVVPGLFAFVAVDRFADPVRRSTLIVDRPAIIEKTTLINENRRETRSIDGGAARKVVINEGPGREMIEKAGGKKFDVVPVKEVVRQTPAPKALRHPAGESVTPDKAFHQDDGKSSGKDDRSMDPGRPALPEVPAEKPIYPSHDRGGGRDHGGGRGGD